MTLPKMPLSMKLPSTKLEKDHPPSSRQTLYGLTLDVSFVVLTTLSDISRAAPVPYLQQAATLALGILAIIQVCGLYRNSSWDVDAQ